MQIKAINRLLMIKSNLDEQPEESEQLEWRRARAIRQCGAIGMMPHGP